MPRQMRMWQPEDVVAALQSVKADGLSLRAAARTYGVPPSTLRAKFHGRVPVVARRGPKTYLTDEEEKKIVDWAIKMGRMGLRQTHSDIQKVVKTLLDKDGRENPFVNNTPGRRWWNSFVKRHPNLIHRKRQPTDKARVMVSDQRIEMWFKEFEARLQKERALSMLSEPHRLFDDKKESALDGILSEFSGSASTSAPSRPSPAQPVQSTPSTIPLSEPWSGQLRPDAAQTPSGLTQIPPGIIQTIPNNEVTVLNMEYLAAPPGMSLDQRKKKGLPPAAITVAEFFRYVRARRTRENHEEKVEQRRKNGELFKKVETEEDEETDEEDMEEDEMAVETTMKEREVTEGTVATPKTEQAREERKKREVEHKKKKKEKRKMQMQQKNKEEVIEIMNSAHDPDSEERRKQLKEENEKAKKIKQERAEKMKKKKEKMKKKQEKEKKKANSNKTKMEEHEGEHEAERLRKDTIIEAKDKVRTKSNIKTITSEGEIYICPACSKSSVENEKWINCDHCVRWLHLSCTSMHLLRGIDLAGFVYRCKFC